LAMMFRSFGHFGYDVEVLWLLGYDV
jgi:hypothetical protein